jgi:hypothetical protein
MLSIFLALPITDIYFGFYYLNEDICNSSINISLPLWLLVKGAVKIFSSILIIIYHLSKRNSCCANFTGLLYIISNLFLLIWVILGCITFIRDCYNLKPTELNTFIWISLVLETIFILGSKKSLDRY